MCSQSKKFWRRSRRWVIRSFLLLFTTWVVLSVWQAPPVRLGKSAGQELRGIWMTHIGATLMYYTTRLDEVVANIAAHHLNTLYPAIWNRGYTLHPSSVTRRAGGSTRHPLLSLPLLPYQDVLSGLVYQAHRQRLRLIPWFEYGLMIPPQSPIARQHPDWLTLTQAGQKTLAEDQPPRAGAKRDVGVTVAWLNPFHPQVQQFLTDLIVEVVKRYPVDGIQLDDHFGLPIAFGYDPYTVKLYGQEHGRQKPPAPTDPEWIAWRADKITQLMSKISRAVKSTRRGAIVSLSPNAPDFAYRNYLQDWTRWVELGLLDEAIVQVYRQDLASFKAELETSALRATQAQVPLGIGLYTGPFLKPKPISEIRAQVETAQTAGYRGVSFFCWETTLWLFKGGSASGVKREFLRQFPKPSSVPSRN